MNKLKVNRRGFGKSNYKYKSDYFMNINSVSIKPTKVKQKIDVSLIDMIKQLFLNLFNRK